MRQYLATLILMALILGIPCTGLSRSYVVSPTGHDGNPGTQGSPWRTLGRASTGLQPGDTVLVRAGTYHERIEITNSGTLAAPIVYRAYPGEHPEIDGEANGDLNVVTVWSSHVVIEGFLITNQNYFKAPGNRTCWVALEGNYIRFRHNRVVAYGDVYDNIYNRRAESRGVVVAGKFSIVENCYVRGQVMGIVIAGPSPRYVIIRHDTVHATGQNNINNTSTSGGETAYHGTLIEYCQLDTSFIEDNIQFEVDYNDPESTLHNRGTIVRNNVMGNAIENAIDLKGAGHTIIENNLIYSSSGDDDGPLLGDRDTRSGGGVTSNPNNPTRNTIIRRNVIWDHCTGMEMAEGDRYYNNTILNNRRTWQGPNQTGSGHTAIRAWNYPDYNRAFLNNIVGAQPNIGVFDWLMDYGEKFHLDANLYYDSSSAPRFHHRMNGSRVTTVGVRDWKDVLETHGGYSYMRGKDVKAVEADPRFVNAPIYAWGYDPSWNFGLKEGSPAIDAGVSVTSASNEGSGSTQLLVDDAYFFCDGFGITGGDMIMIGSAKAVQIAAINYQTNMITLVEPRSWEVGVGVHLAFEGNAPDIGAIEYTGGSEGAMPPVAPALVSPDNQMTNVAMTSSLSWTPALNAQAYQVQISLNPSFDVLTVAVSGLTSSSFPIAALAGATTYYWRVRATSHAGSSPWSSVRSFTTANDATGADKHKPSVLTNGGFESGVSSWTFYTNGSGSIRTASAAWEGMNALEVAVQTPGSNVQLYQSGLALAESSYYKLTFTAYSSSGHDLAVGLMQHVAPYQNYGLWNRTVALGNDWRTYDVYLKTENFTDEVDDARLQFWFSGFAESGDVYWIDDVSLSLCTPPDLPAQVTCSPLLASDHEYYDQVRVHWSEVPFSDGYDVQIAADAQFDAVIAELHVADTLALVTSLASSSQYYIRVRAYNVMGSGPYSEAMTLWTTSTKTDVQEAQGMPGAYALDQNFPNPFNPSTTIRFTLPMTSLVRLTVYDALGREIRTLVDKQCPAGTMNVSWNGSTVDGDRVASGVYFYRIQAQPVTGAAPYVELRKMALVK